MSRRAYYVQVALVAIGLLITVYLTALHYDTQIPLVCSHDGIIDCQAVLSSPQSTWFGVPVSAYGGIWFLAYGAIILTLRERTTGWRRAWAMLGAGVVCYLVYVEFVQLGAICLWCSSLHLMILSLFGIEMAHWTAEDPPSADNTVYSHAYPRNSGRKSTDHSESL